MKTETVQIREGGHVDACDRASGQGPDMVCFVRPCNRDQLRRWIKLIDGGAGIVQVVAGDVVHTVLLLIGERQVTNDRARRYRPLIRLRRGRLLVPLLGVKNTALKEAAG